VAPGCVVCHAGRAEAVDGTVHRINFLEQVIGCENCHGPGSRHEARYRGLAHEIGPFAAGEDPTIVNPGKLSRQRVEDVCAACHLSGPATVALRGRQPGDFRPGMPLTDYRVDYRFEAGDELMTVAGHVAQLRKSACYQQSADLTCLTCHDPHLAEKPKDPASFYRQKCLDCHSNKGCSQAPRLPKEARDNCLTCHMPRGDTEMPHLAFTNHRILRQAASRPSDLRPGRALVPADSSGKAPELALVYNASDLAVIDQQRNLGLAYYAASRNPVYVNSGYAGAFAERARGLLEAVDAAGLHEPATAAALADLYWKNNRDAATAYARQALKAVDISSEARVSCLLILAGADMQERQFNQASRRLEEVVRWQRAASDWYFLGLCYLEQDQPSRALPALEQSLAIRPDRSAVHARLAQAYGSLGDVKKANDHRDKARWLFQRHD
jgi:hypothetical protein